MRAVAPGRRSVRNGVLVAVFALGAYAQSTGLLADILYLWPDIRFLACSGKYGSRRSTGRPVPRVNRASKVCAIRKAPVAWAMRPPARMPVSCRAFPPNRMAVGPPD